MIVMVAMGNNEGPQIVRSMNSTSTRMNRDADVCREIQEMRLVELFEKSPSLARIQVPFFHSKAPLLLHLCLFHNVSLDLIQLVYRCNPEALAAKLFGWLTPLHAAAIRTTANQDPILRFLFPLYTREQLDSLLQVPVIPLVLRRVDCLDIFQFCLQYCGDVTRQRDHAGNTALHVACKVGDYKDIFGSSTYGGCRPGIVKYLVQRYPELVSPINRHGESSLPPLLQSRNPPTEPALLILQAYTPRQIDPLLQLACRNGAAVEVVQALYDLSQTRRSPSSILELAFGSNELFGIGHEASQSAVAYLLEQLQLQRKVDFQQIPNLQFDSNALALATFFRHSDQIDTVRLVDSPVFDGIGPLMESIFSNVSITSITLQCLLQPMSDLKQAMLRGIVEPPHEALVQHDDFPTLESFVDMIYGHLRHNDHVNHLDLSGNDLPMPEKWLRALTMNQTIESLNLSGLSLGNVSKELLGDIVRSNPNLKQLHLDCAELAEDETVFILEALPDNRNLQCISLDPVSELVMTTAIRVVKENMHITHLQFPYFAHRECDDVECNCQTLRPYWRDVQQLCALNRVVQQHLTSTTGHKERFVCHAIIPSAYSVSMLYGVLRLEPDLWSM
jgi:hypothetical protein